MWLWRPEASTLPGLRISVPRRDDLPEPHELFIVESSRGDCLVVWEPDAVHALISSEQRLRSIPGGPGPQ